MFTIYWSKKINYLYLLKHKNRVLLKTKAKFTVNTPLCPIKMFLRDSDVP